MKTPRPGISRHVLLALSCSVFACGSEAPSFGPSVGGDGVAQAGQCNDDAQTCVADCAATVDSDALQACVDDLQACLETPGADPASCQSDADACLNAANVDPGELSVCLEQCGLDFGDCVPDPGDLGDADQCVTDGLACFETCATGAIDCEVPVIECEDGSFDAFITCIADAQDQATAEQCVQDLAEACSIPTDLDLACFGEAGECAADCTADIEACLAP